MSEKKLFYMYGDSNTYGYDPLASIYDDARLPEKKRWPTILGEELKPYIQLMEDGQNGRCLPKYDWEQKYLLEMLEKYKKLDYFAVMLGTNDLLNQATPNPSEIAKDMEHLLCLVKEVHTECFCIIISPPRLGFPSGHPMYLYQKANEELGRQYHEVAKTYGAGFIDAGKWDLDLIYDGIHLSEEGNRQFADLIRDALVKQKILPSGRYG